MEARLVLDKDDMMEVPSDGVDDAPKPGVIKLRGFNPAKIDPDSPASHWMREFDAMCSANPLNDNALVFEDQAVVVIGRSINKPHDHIELRDIRAITKGGGANCLTTMCEIADKHGVTLVLHAKGYGHVPTIKLVEYYKRFGFSDFGVDLSRLKNVPAGDDNHEGVDMERTPR